MSRRKSVPLVLCLASVLALSLAGCSHNAGKLKTETSLKENVPGESTDADIYGVSRQGGNPFLRSKKSTGASSTSAYENLWERLFARYNLPQVDHPDIRRELDWFINHPTYLDKVQSRAEPFLYSIVRQVEKQNVPGELALLPVIESAFQPHAISPARAAGIWQFIPTTGRLYGLKKSRSYDGRRDVYASTRAAIKYLKKLNIDFNGDWLLSIAAYNCGEGAVSRAIQRNSARGLPTDFWSLDLPRETRSYVPRLLAVARLFADADQYGIDLRQIPNKALFKTVKVKSQLDLALAADAADLSLDQMMELNPGFKRQITDLDGSYRLFVPAHKYRSFKDALPRLAEAGVSRSKHAPAEADSFFQDDLVAAATEQPLDDAMTRTSTQQTHSSPRAERKDRDKYRTKLSEDVTVRDTLIVGRPVATQGSRVQAKISVEPVEKSSEPSLRKASYRVQPGDTLFSIARNSGADLEQVRKWNKLSAKHTIKSGEDIVIWSKDTAKKVPAAGTGANVRGPQSTRYTVKAGDSLTAISKRFNVTLADLRKWNGAKLDRQFRPGMNLTVSSRD